MKKIRIIMGMPITIEIVDVGATEKIFNEIFAYFKGIDKKFSPYKKDSEVSKIDRGEVKKNQISQEMKTILKLSEITRKQTDNFFNVYLNSKFDPSGLVKGWAIQNASQMLLKKGFRNFYINAGGDIQAVGHNKFNQNWKIGIKNPFNKNQIVKKLSLTDKGIATSGTYEKGNHIQNPTQTNTNMTEIVSLSVIGPNIYEADRFATAAFAMGRSGINFIEKQKGLEGYLIDANGIATYTSGFKKYTLSR